MYALLAARAPRIASVDTERGQARASKKGDLLRGATHTAQRQQPAGRRCHLVTCSPGWLLARQSTIRRNRRTIANCQTNGADDARGPACAPVLCSICRHSSEPGGFCWRRRRRRCCCQRTSRAGRTGLVCRIVFSSRAHAPLGLSLTPATAG